MFTGTKSYSGLRLADWTNGAIFDVIEVSGDRVVIGKGTAVTAAVNRYSSKGGYPRLYFFIRRE